MDRGNTAPILKPTVMAIATFHSERGEKSALILVKANAFVFSATPVYIPRAAVEGMKKGDIIEIPDGYSLVDMLDEDGNARTTESGEHLKTLSYA